MRASMPARRRPLPSQYSTRGSGRGCLPRAREQLPTVWTRTPPHRYTLPLRSLRATRPSTMWTGASAIIERARYAREEP